MPVEFHTLEAPDGLNGFAVSDRIFLGLVTAAYGAGGGAGTAVTSAVAWAGSLPATYQVFVAESADVTAWVSARSATGFTLTVEPRNPANTIAAGSVAALVVA